MLPRHCARMGARAGQCIHRCACTCTGASRPAPHRPPLRNAFRTACRREARAAERSAAHSAAQAAALAGFNPKEDANAAGTDPMKTLFVSRLDFATAEADLKVEFGRHGPIRHLALVKDQSGKSKGYAFIEYEHGGDMKAAYKAYPPDGFVQIGGSKRWSIVDVERGRTVPDWCAVPLRALH